MVKKPTVLISNSETIKAQLNDFRSTGHAHYPLFGSSRTDAMKIWPWELAERLIEGLIQLKRKLSRSSVTYTSTVKDTNKDQPAPTKSSFPEMATDTADPGEPASSSSRPWW